MRKPSPASPSVFSMGTRTPDVAHLAVRGPAAAAMSHGRNRTDDLDARRVCRDDDLRRAPVRVGFRIGDGHDDPERSPLGARREPLVTVDDPLVAVAHCTRAERRRIGARHLGLGHREERAHLSSDERLEPALLLLVRPEPPQDLPVSRVGRLAAEDELTPERAADLLVQVRVDEEAPARAARLGRQVRRPQPLRPSPPRGAARRARPASSSSRSSTGSFGYTCSSMKARTRARSSRPRRSAGGR